MRRARDLAEHFRAARLLLTTPADWSSLVDEAPLEAYLRGRGAPPAIGHRHR